MPKPLEAHGVRARHVTIVPIVVMVVALVRLAPAARAARAGDVETIPFGQVKDPIACRSANIAGDRGTGGLTRGPLGGGTRGDTASNVGRGDSVRRISTNGPVMVFRSDSSWLSASPSPAFEGPYRIGPLRTGGGTSNDTTVMFVWVGAECTASLSFTGTIIPTSDERDIEVGEGGSFTAIERGRTDREYAVWSLRGQRFRYLKVNSNVAHISAHDAQWFAEMVQEYIRRTGTGANDRARRIMRRDGAPALLDEVSQILDGEIRATYLVASYADVTGGRSVFVQRGAELLQEAKSRTRFLSSLPPQWRTDESVLAEVYRAAAVIEVDDCLSEILNAAEPPRPVPPSLRAPLDSLIAALHSEPKRRELRARYFDAPHSPRD